MPLSEVAAVLMVVAGVFLFEAFRPALLLIGLGVLTMPALRELGLVNADEHRMEIGRRAGTAAFLVGGWLIILMLVAQPWERVLDPEFSFEFVGYQALLAMVLTYFFVVVVSYWGAPVAVSRILLVFGGFWLLFVVLSHITEPVALLLEGALFLPILILSVACRRWPRSSGAILIALGVAMFILFHGWQALGERPQGMFALIGLVLPTLASGILLAVDSRPGSGEADGERQGEEAPTGLDGAV
jgi:hypothetical protein